MPDATIETVWECPKCGLQIAQVPPMIIHPSRCAMGHQPVEMEQKMGAAWDGPSVPEVGGGDV